MGLFKRNDSPYWWYYVELDGRKVGKEIPGPITERLIVRFQIKLRKELSGREN
jgi:hypothetical protein